MKTMNYDPNIKFAKQSVRLTFGLWDYRFVTEVDVGGNCKGQSIIESAVDNYFDKLPFVQVDGGDMSSITLARQNGDSLKCDDDELRGIEWLKNMLIGAEIVSIAAEND